MLSILATLPIATAAAAQPTGEIFGKATDQSAAVLPGVTVTLSAPSLLQPLTAVTSATGTYQSTPISSSRSSRIICGRRSNAARIRDEH